jgi:hypothetical protein
MEGGGPKLTGEVATTSLGDGKNRRCAAAGRAAPAPGGHASRRAAGWRGGGAGQTR